MPRVEIGGVRVISFPMLDSQIRDIIKHAERAPYGRRRETVKDTLFETRGSCLPNLNTLTPHHWRP